MIRSLITGVTGQDGTYLAQALLARGDQVFGTMTHCERDVDMPGIELRPMDLTDPTGPRSVIEAVRPDRIYHLAAMSSVALAWREPLMCAQVNAMGTIALLEAVREIVPEARLVNASSSEIYAVSRDGRLREDSPFGPRNPYGSAKLHAHLAVTQARTAFGVHASNAVLFGHESPIRPDRFVSRKITSTLARIAAGADEVLALGNIDVERDWGHAQDFVRAFMLIGEQENAGDFIVATGELLSVRDFVQAAAEAVGITLEWQGRGLDERGMSGSRTIVTIEPAFFRPVDAPAASGDPGPIVELGWNVGRTARRVAKEMALADLAFVTDRV